MKFSGKLFLLVLLLIACTCCRAQGDSLKYSTPRDSSFHDSLPSSLYIAGISVYGNKKTKTYILEREVPFKEGDRLSPEQLAQDLITAKQQLINTSLFLNVDIYIQNRYGELVFITIYVKERWYILPLPYFKYIDPNFNTWWVTYNHSLKRVNYGIKFLHNNITGRNDKFTAWFITGYSKSVALKYERPFFDKKLKSGYSLFASYTNQRELNYGTDSGKRLFFRPDSLFYVRQGIRLEADYTYRPGLRTTHIFRVGFISERIADTIAALNHNYFKNGNTNQSFPYIGYTFRYSNADYNFYPTRGFLSETSILHRGFSSSMNLTQLQTINSYTIPILPKTQFQVKEGAVISLPFNQPYYNKQLFGYTGGIFMRGYEYYVMDGVAGFVGRATLQHELFRVSKTISAGTKREWVLPFRFYAKLYSDAGYAYDKEPNGSMLSNRLLHSWGLGIDMITAYDVIFKFDYSFNQLGGNGLFIHVSTDF